MTLVIGCYVSSDVVANQTVKISTDHIYGRKAGMALTFDVVRPSEKSNGIGLLYMVSRGFVSNYFDLEAAMSTSQKRGGRFSELTNRGYTLFIVRHGSAPYFKVPDAVKDVRLALRFIVDHSDRFGIDPDRLGVFGNSAGGHLALMLGVAPDEDSEEAGSTNSQRNARTAAVVAYYPPVDLRQQNIDSESIKRLKKGPLDFDVDLQHSVSPIAHVSKDSPPTLLIHGDRDMAVPLKNSQRIHKEFQKHGVTSELIIMEGAGHAFPGEYGQRAAKALADWFDRHLVGT